MDDSMKSKYLEEWRVADKDGSGRLSLSEIERLLNKLNLGLKSSDVKQRFNQVDKDGSKELDFGEFCVFLDALYSREEFKKLFEQYSDSKPFLSAEGLVKFLHQQQLELHATVETAKAIIKKYELSADKSIFHFEGFSSYLVSADNSIYNIEHTNKVYQPMSFPLSHYFIASSHNTYAEAHQLVGVASVDAYVTALKRGCKMLELDIWDGDDGQPVITHGHTLLTKIKFYDVIVAIRDHGFCVSPYPVILSFENHCTEKQQVRMAEILSEILGGAGMLPGHLFDQVFPLPSPEQLSRKVLIKSKVYVPPVEITGAPTNKKKKEEVLVAQELSKLAHLQAVKFPGFPHKHENKVWKMFSISEQKINAYHKSQAELIEITSSQCVKVYPKGTRFDSSNYSPVSSWASGCQMVCLNYQTHDEPMWLNTGKFSDNGGSGYVLKPPTLLSNQAKSTPKKLTINLISGWHLPKETGTSEGSIINPFARIKIFGSLEDTKKAKSKVVKLDGLNPVWNETFTFDLARPEIAQVIFEVYEFDRAGKNDFLGFSSIPVPSLKQGYRNVHLLNSKSVPLERASLFVKILVE